MNKASREELLSSLTKLHSWRVSFNGNDIGYGFDEYKPDERFHYPEAYAIFGRGYLKLYQVTREKEYLECAMKCVDWLLENPSLRYTNLSWGLPWEWKEWNAPKDMTYVCTTSYCGDFAIDLYLATKNERFKNMAISISEWLIHENGYRKASNGVDFYYANHEPLKFSIYNHNALAMGFLSKLYSLTQKEEHKKLTFGVSNFLINNQNSDGSWHYSENNKLIDNLHSAFMIEGFVDFLDTFKENNARDALSKAVNFYQQAFYQKNGKGREIINKLDKKSNITKSALKYMKRQVEFGPPGRLWSYGSGIRALSKTLDIFQNDVLLNNIVHYAISKLQDKTGAFAFTEQKPNFYIRNEEHIFDGLATLLSHS